MGIYNALFAGASGLTSFGESIRVAGDNIANVNTIGFKSQNVTFTDVLSQTIGVSNVGANQVGNGVKIGSITRNQAQGSVQTTTSATDMTINGNGLFALRDPATNQTSFSRDGSFQLDKSFNLINGGGNVVQGYAIDALTGKATGSLTDLTFGSLAAQAQPTTTITAALTLDAASPTPATAAFDPADPATYNFKTDAVVYDTLGGAHTISQHFVRIGADATGNMIWDYHISTDGANVAGGTAGTPIEINPLLGAPLTPTAPTKSTTAVVGNQALVFNANGALQDEFAPKMQFSWAGGTATDITMNFGNATTTDAQANPGNGTDATVQTAGSFATRQITKDGYPSGFLDKLITDSSGIVSGAFTNGQRRPLFQVALAKFPNDSVLNHVGGNMMQETIQSGTPVFEKPGNGGMGTITPYGLESSNVDLASEFVKLIVVQRGYEANSKTIMTTDQMLSSLMQLKR
ncbi:MAG: flagellar hook protein FlgE [Mariprofundus sp.]|nr:flagellar hook protein FlgE [Mariprofundus sp.]